MQFILMIAACGSFAMYAYAMNGTFARDHAVDWRMRLLQFCGTVSAMVHLWCLGRLPYQQTWRLAISLILYASGLSVFSAAKRALRGFRLTLAFSSDKPQRLVHEGIYSRIRHPFYLAYTLTWLAGCVAAPSGATLITTVLMLTFYLEAAFLEERKFARSSLNAEYATYRAHTGMLWPK